MVRLDRSEGKVAANASSAEIRGVREYGYLGYWSVPSFPPTPSED